MFFGLFLARKCLYRRGFPSGQQPDVIAGRMVCRVILNTSVSVRVRPKVMYQWKPPATRLEKKSEANPFIIIVRVDQRHHLIQESSFSRLVLEAAGTERPGVDAQDMTLPGHVTSNSGSRWEPLYFPGGIFNVWRHSFCDNHRDEHRCSWVCRGQEYYQPSNKAQCDPQQRVIWLKAVRVPRLGNSDLPEQNSHKSWIWQSKKQFLA